MIGHVLRQDQNSDCYIAMTWAPKGKRREEDQPPGGERLKREGQNRADGDRGSSEESCG